MRHGTVDGYKNHYCRCSHCTDANRAYLKAYRHRLKVANTDGQTWVLFDFPLSIVARKAFPDDDAAIAAAYPPSRQEAAS